MPKAYREEEVWITGVGTITPFATGWHAVYGAVSQGRTEFPAWEASLNPPYTEARLGIIKALPKDRFFNDRQLRLMDRAMILAAVATGLALEDAGIDPEAPGSLAESIATVFSSMRAELPSLYRFATPLLEESGGAFNPALFPMIARNIGCGQAALRFGLRGWSTMISCGEISGLHALARAIDLVRSGRAPMAIAGAYEALSKLTLHQIRARWLKYRIDPATDADGQSQTPAEGACLLIIESRSSAELRGAKPYARLTGASHSYVPAGAPNDPASFVARHVARTALSASPDIIGISNGDRLDATSVADQAIRSELLRLWPHAKEAYTRPVFGDAASQSILLQAACAAQAIRDRTPLPSSLMLRSAVRRTERPPESVEGAILTQTTDRGAFGMVGIRTV